MVEEPASVEKKTVLREWVGQDLIANYFSSRIPQTRKDVCYTMRTWVLVLAAIAAVCALLPVTTVSGAEIVILHTDAHDVAKQAEQMHADGTAPARFQQMYAHNEEPSSDKTAPVKDNAEPAKEEAASKDTTKKTQGLSQIGFDAVCDASFQNGLCIGGGRHMIIPDNVPKGLVLSYDFDSENVVDSSRMQNHAKGVVSCAADHSGGKGCSGRFDGDVYTMTPSSESLSTARFTSTICYWVNVISVDAGVDMNCPVVVMGAPKALVAEVGVNQKTKSVYAAFNNGEVKVTSNARLGAGWHHVCAVRSKDKAKIFVNGIKDGEADVGVHAPKFDNYDVYVGQAPFVSPECDLQFLLDDLKVFGRARPNFAIGAEAFPSLGSADPTQYSFGCRGCSFDAAQKACSNGRHICSEGELLGGGFSVASKMGWGSLSSRFYKKADTKPVNADEKGVGICCAD